MVVGTLTNECVCEVEAKRLWKAIVKDGHNLFPKVFPEAFSSITFVEGDGGVGTIKQVNFTPDNQDFSYFKEKVDEIDEEKMVFKFTIIEGGPLGTQVNALSFELKVVPREEVGCVVTRITNYETVQSAQTDDVKLQELKENATATFKKIDQYLVSNPNLCC
jgi:hypothetical protein